MNQIWLGKIQSKGINKQPKPLELRTSPKGIEVLSFQVYLDSGFEGSIPNPHSTTNKNYNYGEFVNVALFGEVAKLFIKIGFGDGDWFAATNGALVKKTFTKQNGDEGTSWELKYPNLHLSYLRKLNEQNLVLN